MAFRWVCFFTLPKKFILNISVGGLNPVVKVKGARGAQPPASTLAEFGPPARMLTENML